MTLNNATRVHPRLSIESAAIDTETDKPTNRSMKKAMNMKLNERFADGSGSSPRTLTLVMFGYNHEALCALAEADVDLG